MFITIEGPDGSGKTSQIKPLVAYLQEQGYPVFSTREPGGTLIGEQVRSILASMDNKMMNPRTETLLFCAGRAQHVDEVILPRLKQGEIVLCDRYIDSTLAYQGYGHGNDLDFLRRLLDFATFGLRPNFTLLLDIESEAGLRRKRGGKEWDRLDDYDLTHHRRVRAGYLELARAEPQRWVIIDASRPKPVVQEAMRAAILTRLRSQ